MIVAMQIWDQRLSPVLDFARRLLVVKASEKQNRDRERPLQDAEIRERLGHISNKLLVMSGKGGVGKSCVAAYPSISLAAKELDWWKT